jgi:hypothetical protein
MKFYPVRIFVVSALKCCTGGLTLCAVIEKDSAVVTVAWAPAEYGAHQLLICTESEVSVWSRFQLLSDQFQTTPAAQIRLPDTVLCKWVAPPVIYHLEKPQETFESIGEKFRPQEMPESQYRDVTISFAFITISSGGVVRWFYKRTSNPTLSVLEHSLNMNVTHADIMFTSCASLDRSHPRFFPPKRPLNSCPVCR